MSPSLFARLQRHPGMLLAATGTTALALVAASVVLTKLLHLQPCPLCIFQRILLIAIGLICLAGAGMGGVARGLPRRLGAGLAGFTALGGIGVAAYQSYLQLNTVDTGLCGATDPTLIERLVDWLGLRWPLLFSAPGVCSSKEWVLLGLSLANWAGLAFLAFFVVSLLALRARPH